MTDDARGPKDPGPKYHITSRFKSFVSPEGERTAEESEWIESFAREHNVLALRDHQHEGREIGDMERQMADMLAATGYHEIKWLRKNVREIRVVDMNELSMRLEPLRRYHEDELVELVLNVRRGFTPKAMPALPAGKGVDKNVKLAALKVMAERGDRGEAVNAKHQAEKLARELAVHPQDDLMDLDWDDMKVESVATPMDLLIKALDERLDWQEPMAKIRYRFREEARHMHDQHCDKLVDILNDPHGLSKRKHPIVERVRRRR